MIKKICFSLVILVNIISCNSQQNVITNATKESINSISNKNNVKGIVKFPETDFKIKADITDVSHEATVSILYPSDNSTNPNKTIATGLSNSQGSFSINSDSNFQPGTDEIFVLEAVKRINGISNNNLSIRTFIKWSGSAWQSITTNGIYINSYTNALAIIANYNKDIISSDDTIGKIVVDSNGSSVVSDIGTEPDVLVTSEIINEVKDLVNQSLAENKDPFSAITHDGYNYHINRDSEIGQLKQTNACVGCNFTGQRLPDILKGANLANSNLSKQYLSNINLLNTNLSGSNISDSILTNKDLRVVANKNLSSVTIINSSMSGVNLSGRVSNPGVNLSDSNLSNSNISYSDLRYTNLTNAILSDTNLSYSDFTGATVSPTTNFSGAYMSNSIWIDGTVFDDDKVCAENSLGQCN